MRLFRTTLPRQRPWHHVALASLSLWAVCVTGCAGPAPPERGMAVKTAGGEVGDAPEPEATVDDYEVRIGELEADLAARLTRAESSESPMRASELESDADYAAPPSSAEEAPSPLAAPSRCEVAFDLRDRICELARRICVLADSNSTELDMRERCASASDACERARADVSATCGRP